MKTKREKRINQKARKLNRQLKEDVFKDRFYIRQYRKSKINGIMYYLYQLYDAKQPERKKIIGWYSEFTLDSFNDLWVEMNKFIITSDF